MLDLSESTVYEFHEFRLDVQSHRLFRRGSASSVVALTPKAIDVLLALIRNRNRLLTKAELLDLVWKDSFVEESNLTQTIFVLRKTLGDSTKEPRFILTVPNRGYQFVAEVTEIRSGDDILEETILAEKERPEEPTAIVTQKGAFTRYAPLIAIPLLVLLVAAVFRYYPTKKPVEPVGVKIVAIMPFEDLSEQQQDRYLGVSIADALAKQFGGLKNLTVRPIQSVLKYADRQNDYTSIGRELQVDAVLEGRIQRFGDRLRVNSQLIRVSDNMVVWTENFDDSFTNFFAVQDSISQKVVTSLAVKMDDTERRRFEQRGTADVEAYQAYMRGRYFWNKRSAESLQKAIEQFDIAVKEDPDYALGYTGLADCYQLLVEYGVATDSKESFSKARTAAQKALSLDNNLAEAHTALAYTQAFYDWDWAGAERSFKWALELNPNYATAHQWYAEYLEAVGRFDEARMHFERAQEIDPVSLILMADMASYFHMTRDFDQAIEQSKKIIAIDPTFAYGYYYLAVGYARKGMHTEAVAGYAQLLSRMGEPAESIAEINRTFASDGWLAYQRKRLQQVNTLPYLKNLPSFNRAFINTEAGDYDAAIKELQRSVDRHERLVIYIKYAPDFDPLRDDPRFQELVDQIGI